MDSGCSLFCHRVAGGRTTFILALVVDALHRHFPSCEIGIAVPFCSYKTREEQNAGTFLARLLRQLMKPEHTESHRVQALVGLCGKTQRRPVLHELAELLHFAAETFEKVFIIIDALDECRITESQRLMSKLWRLQSKLPNIRLMATARSQLNFSKKFKVDVRLEISAHEADLTPYITSHISQLSKQVIRMTGPKESVVNGVIQAANGM
jgi:hypothetical protein